MTRFTFAASLTLIIIGCTPVADGPSAVPQTPGGQSAISLGSSEADYLVLLVVDTSDTFRQQMAEEGRAYRFATKLIDRYFRDRIGTDDRLIIARLSGSDRSLIYDGKPLELRQKFPTAEAFRTELLGHADAGGSRIYTGLRHAMSYLLSDPRVQSGKARPALFVLSDLLDKTPPAEVHDEEGYMNHSLCELAWRNGIAGFYFVDQNETSRWVQRLIFCGVKNYRVEMAERENPPFPSFDN